MNNKPKNIEEIEAYYYNNMSDLERTEFERKIKEDAELSLALEKFKIAELAITLLVENKNREKFKAWRARKNNNPIIKGLSPLKIRFNKWKNLAIAASFLMLVSFSLFYLLTKPSENLVLATNYYIPIELDNLRNRQSEEMKLAIDFFENRKYAKTLKVLNKTPESIKKNYLIAHTHFKNGNLELAENSFRQLLNWEDSSYKREAEWGLLVSLLAQDKKEKEFNQLMDSLIKNGGDFFSNKANNLKQAIEAD